MVLLVLLAFWLPGTALGLALRLRSWTLVAAAPVLTFGIVALGTVALGNLHVRWNLASVSAWVVVLVVLAGLGTWLLSRRSKQAGEDDGRGDIGWTASTLTLPLTLTLKQHLVVGAGVAAGIGVGLVTFLRGVGNLDAIQQDWDAPYHGNAVRWIAEHQNALPSDLAPIANQAGLTDYFYPNTYHALLALLLDHGGSAMPELLNLSAMTVILTWPLGVAAVGLAWRMPPVAVAISATVSTWFGTFPYDSLWRGPLWPFVAGVALVPAALALVRHISHPAPRAPLAGPVGAGLAAAGLVGLHTSLAFVLAVYLGMLLVAMLLRWEPVAWRAAARPMAFSVLVAGLLVVPVFAPALSSAGGVLAALWPKLSVPAEAFGQAALFSPPDPMVQWYLGIPALIGLALMVQQRVMIWVVGAYVFLAALFVAAAAHILAPLHALTGIFYTDVWRIAALLPLAGALAVGTLGGRLAHAAGDVVASRAGTGSWARPAASAVALALFVAVLAGLSSGAYIDRNSSRLSSNYGDGPTVSRDEQQAYAWLAERVTPDERVANDVTDGGVWLYALDGVRPTNWTFYGTAPGSDVQFLLDNLNRLDTDPRVRETLAHLNVRYVLFGEGTVRPDSGRSPGMIGLDSVAGLQEVFHNPGATIYEVLPPPLHRPLTEQGQQ